MWARAVGLGKRRNYRGDRVACSGQQKSWLDESSQLFEAVVINAYRQRRCSRVQ
jgi:hypothetical protein